MAQAAYKVVDRRGQTIFPASNLLVPAAVQNRDRAPIPVLDLDFHRNVSALGRRQLLSSGRRLYSGNSVVRAAINEMATSAVSTFQRQSMSKTPGWGEIAESTLADDDNFCDLRGPPFTMGIFRRNLINGVIRDGDVGVILTEDGGENGRIQVIPGHRIGDWNLLGQSIVRGGAYDGARIIDGVIVNDYGAAMAYRVMGENPLDRTNFQDIPAASMILAFLPEYPDQLRGLSFLGASVFTWQDVAETDYHERIAQKIGAKIYLVEKNPTGTVDRTKALLAGMEHNPDPSTNAAESLVEEISDDGTIRYFKSGTGSGLESFTSNRPGQDSQRFSERQQQYALSGLGWSYEYTVDPSKLGGVNGRLVMDKLNRHIGMLQEHVVVPACRRIDGYRVSKFVKNGKLEPDVDWWRWEFQGPAELTGDAKYDSDIDIQENRAGFRPMRDITAKRGTGYWREVRKQKVLEADDLLTEAGALAAKHGLPIANVLPLISDTNTASTLTATVGPDPTGQGPRQQKQDPKPKQ